MSNDASKNDAVGVSDIDTDLPAAAAALSAEDRADLVNALKDKLQLLAGQHVDILDTLSPIIRERVDVLRGLQSQHDELEAKFLEERASLEAKYQKLYEPLYTKRYEIVNGVVEVEGITDEAVTDKEDNATEEKGVPDFWLTAMKTNETLADEVEELQSLMEHDYDIGEVVGPDLGTASKVNVLLNASSSNVWLHLTDTFSVSGGLVGFMVVCCGVDLISLYRNS
ncbi:nucleosome assembly protein 1;4-like [Senna tora]|uniref:Nucleosome assembly protein 14-like n=1 Tax=Senna tora TaxID=362788 RepID=A0A835CJF1_9FABA|nr:nucleosome assembly protein 1;4-like [Senna tora]